MLDQALAAEQQAYRAQLRGEPASAAYAAARDAYLASHAQTGPRSWGRLIGALKMAILAGDGVGPVALRALDENEDEPGASAAYAGALAAVALGRRPRVREMLDAGDAFARTGRRWRRWATATRPPTRPRWRRSWPTSRPVTGTCQGARGRHGDGAGAARRAARDGRAAADAADSTVDILRPHGAIAQLGERRAGSAKVTGSSPVSSIALESGRGRRPRNCSQKRRRAARWSRAARVFYVYVHCASTPR